MRIRSARPASNSPPAAVGTHRRATGGSARVRRSTFGRKGGPTSDPTSSNTSPAIPKACWDGTRSRPSARACRSSSRSSRPSVRSRSRSTPPLPRPQRASRAKRRRVPTSTRPTATTRTPLPSPSSSTRSPNSTPSPGSVPAKLCGRRSNASSRCR
ncbi:Uncharacterised protein [Mycobacteroides abscessus subsp. abscessus]|nr:Uncharacterised protein [Mycobacteroides abscessus subsp. abscessus]